MIKVWANVRVMLINTSINEDAPLAVACLACRRTDVGPFPVSKKDCAAYVC